MRLDRWSRFIKRVLTVCSNLILYKSAVKLNIHTAVIQTPVERRSQSQLTTANQYNLAIASAILLF